MIPDDLSVLLVEDNPGDARLIEELFRETDHPVALVEPGAEPPARGVALHHRDRIADVPDALATYDPDVVLLDLDLPESSGTDTVETVRGHTATTPIVVLTGAPEDRFGVDVVSEGAQDYLVKDEVTPEVLLRAVRYALERKRIEGELRQRTEELRILNQLTRHDIRNEMTLVVGRARELEEHVDVHGRDALDEIVRSSNHILQLTGTIGDIVASVTGDDDTDLGPVALGPVLQSEVETARGMYDVAVETPAAVPDVSVRANDLLASVLSNLLSNAVLYNDKETPEVSVSLDVEPETVVVRVADNGPGIPDRRKDEVFAEGAQGADSGGMGIGLYLVSRLVDRYGGDVWVEDNDPVGAVFCVELVRADRGPDVQP
ncbi:ATP-binding protein [Halobium salinum]|uniref:ATP-binding protein n=1 Tax=Halobium salinum TaxID=1364940 RepID=A0ABD5PB31_9EURY|nr:ATP-binding protein [Halobium salinum]